MSSGSITKKQDLSQERDSVSDENCVKLDSNKIRLDEEHLGQEQNEPVELQESDCSWGESNSEEHDEEEEKVVLPLARAAPAAKATRIALPSYDLWGSTPKKVRLDERTISKMRMPQKSQLKMRNVRRIIEHNMQTLQEQRTKVRKDGSRKLRIFKS